MPTSDKNTNTFQEVENAIEKWWSQNHKPSFNPDEPKVKLHDPTFGPEEITAVTKQLLTTYVTMGEKVQEFEKLYCKQYGYTHGVSNNSGSSANLLMLAALTNPHYKGGLNPGDEVIIPALTWSTSLWPIIQNNLVPCFVDSDLDTLNISPNAIEEAIGPRTKAIMAVPVYGNPCDYDALLDICERHNLILIEDACESMGARYKGKSVGSFGKVSSFSFYYSHHITTLEGGICVTEDFELAELMRIIRAHGWVRHVEDRQKWLDLYPDIDPKFLFVNEGYNLRITEPQAAMGLIQVPKLDGFINARKSNAEFYQTNLGKYSEYLTFHKPTKQAEHSWFGYAMVIKETAPFSRTEICDFLNKKGIETRTIIAGNLARQPGTLLYPHRVSGSLAIADHVMTNGFSIGVHQGLESEAKKYVVSTFDEFFKSYGF
ncbi:DegT/DnrJ/EryC1/StrS family aminotransferase [Kiloniella litopenaei]|uniref:DegT/DnrJ/EryC1/StrS family aminotransferase n=1 Tax=Kiloniella litopenaei TaxID=1549748 RepID=UPI003BAA4C9E